ncbi:hypothetical protein V8D89_006404 [Ganoderma adspersum]
MSRSSDQQAMEHWQLQAHSRIPSNDAALINALPPELFLKVLRHVHLLIKNTSMQIADNTWTIPYQLVCRRWRDVICSTPQFWQEMKVWRSPKWLEFSLNRCAGAPASVSVYKPTRPEETFATLRRFATSIRVFRLDSDVPDMASLPGLPSFLAMPMPILETLFIDGPYGDEELVDVPITRDLVPRLTALTLSNCTAPLDTAVYTSLRDLTLFKSPWTISYGDFLGVMRKCQVLEYLSLVEGVLDAAVAQIGDLETGHLPNTTPVVLPRLRTLKLSGHPKVLFHLLATIHAPQVVVIRLNACLNDGISGPGPLLLTHLLAPDPEVRYPFLSSPRTVSLTQRGTYLFQLSFRCGPRGNGRVYIDHQTNGYQPERASANLQDNLGAVMDTFSVASVDTLEVKGTVDQIAAETWQRAFLTFSGLRTLTLAGDGTLDAVWAGLLRATNAAVEHGGAVCCPLLSEIVTDNDPSSHSPFKFSATPTLLEGVRTALRARADAGGARLEKLKLYVQYPESSNGETETSCRDNVVLEDMRIDPEVYKSLRNLSISTSVWTLPYGEFLDAFGKCHALEHLTLDEDILDPFNNQIEYLATNYPALILPVILPRTKSEISNSRIASTTTSPDPLSYVSSPPIRTYGSHSSPRLIPCGRAPFKLCLQCGPDGHALFSVDYGMVHNEFWPGNANLQHNLIALMDTFSVASVHVLEVEGYLDAVPVET